MATCPHSGEGTHGVATSELRTDTDRPLADTSSARVFHLVVAALTVAGLGVFVARGSVPLDVPELLAWILASLLADLMYVRIGKSITHCDGPKAKWPTQATDIIVTTLISIAHDRDSYDVRHMADVWARQCCVNFCRGRSFANSERSANLRV